MEDGYEAEPSNAEARLECFNEPDETCGCEVGQKKTGFKSLSAAEMAKTDKLFKLLP